MFRILSEYIWITTEQLRKILELHEDAAFKREIYIAGVGRVTDYENYDFVKTALKPSEAAAMKDIYQRVGLLNLFNPFHPEGTYEFSLQVYEERIMLNILCELAKKEGTKFVTNVLQDKQPVEGVDEFVKAPPKEGTQKSH